MSRRNHHGRSHRTPQQLPIGAILGANQRNGTTGENTQHDEETQRQTVDGAARGGSLVVNVATSIMILRTFR